MIFDILKHASLEGRFMRELVKLVCTECGEENYHTTKNKRTTPDRLEFSKYCPRSRTHTLHREKK